MSYLHNLEVPIFHRDIKPENILITETEAKLADFGCSNLIDEDRMTYCGTPDYIAPEMLLGETQSEKVSPWQLTGDRRVGLGSAALRNVLVPTSLQTEELHRVDTPENGDHEEENSKWRTVRRQLAAFGASGLGAEVAEEGHPAEDICPGNREPPLGESHGVGPNGSIERGAQASPLSLNSTLNQTFLLDPNDGTESSFMGYRYF